MVPVVVTKVMLGEGHEIFTNVTVVVIVTINSATSDTLSYLFFRLFAGCLFVRTCRWVRASVGRSLGWLVCVVVGSGG